MNPEIKYWLSADRQSEIGYWPERTPDAEIIEDLTRDCTPEDADSIKAGTIETAPYQEWMAPVLAQRAL